MEPEVFRPNPGWVLSTIAALSALLVLVPVFGAAFVLVQHGLFAPSALMAILRPPNILVAVMMVPTAILLSFAVVYLIALFSRAQWGPRLVSSLALLWAASVGTNVILVPMLTMPGGLPALTIVMMVPGILAPALFALGFAGFVLQSEAARRWFSPHNSERVDAR